MKFSSMTSWRPNDDRQDLQRGCKDKKMSVSKRWQAKQGGRQPFPGVATIRRNLWSIAFKAVMLCACQVVCRNCCWRRRKRNVTGIIRNWLWRWNGIISHLKWLLLAIGVCTLCCSLWSKKRLSKMINFDEELSMKWWCVAKREKMCWIQLLGTRWIVWLSGVKWFSWKGYRKGFLREH